MGGIELPLYSFVCSKCNKIYEAIVKLADMKNPVKCPHCGRDLEKKMDAPMFRIR
jgi:putative FmdB family regulatory protein